MKLVERVEDLLQLMHGPPQGMINKLRTLGQLVHLGSFQPKTVGRAPCQEIVLEGDEVGAVDGMKADSEGNVYCTGPGGIHVFDGGGKKLGRLRIPPAGPSNMAWGDADWKTLYVTWREAVCKVRMKVPGVPVGPD